MWDDDCNTIDVKFNTWYPYNYGKDVCLSFDPNGFCLGKFHFVHIELIHYCIYNSIFKVPRITFGNHFCDGDSSNLRIQNGQPKFLQLNVHTFGALYEFNNETGVFDFLSGEDLDLGDDVHFQVDYPQSVNLINGHPEIFVSNGSHGNWGAPGNLNQISK